MIPGVLRGVLIVESLRVGGRIDGIPWRVHALTRFEAPAEPVGGPPTWTFLEFEADLDDADRLSSAFARALDGKLAWYASFRSDSEMFVVFAGCSFRYALGDASGKADAESYARSIGVPDAQLDWEQ
jgi:hypothetical protein